MGALRLFLALSISTAHFVDRVFPDLGGAAEGLYLNLNGGRPVMLFFVVSGFLISYVLDRKYEGGHALAAFYRLANVAGDLTYPLYLTHFLVITVTLAAVSRAAASTRA